MTHAFEYYHNTLAVHAGFLYGDSGIMTKSNYDALKSRGWLNQLRRGCKGTPALIEYDSIPHRFKEVIEAEFGDPAKQISKNRFEDLLIYDQQAADFFNSFILDNGKALPADNISEYIANATILNGVKTLINNHNAKRSALGGRRQNIWDNVSASIQKLPRASYPHSLPKNSRRLKQKFEEYRSEGYDILIHKGFGHKNSEKINDDAKAWVLSRWADRVNKVASCSQLLKEYNSMANANGWKKLKDAQTLHLYLHQEEIVHLWFGNRYGEKKSKEKFTYHLSTKMPSYRDSLWYSDGTKLNFWFLNENGKPETFQVYEVMDAYSEVFLGYHVSKTENSGAQHGAYKMAIQFSQQRPYEIKYDNQGGHGKLTTGNFLNKISKIALSTQPYNGKSKTIESAFGRFQQQFLKKLWFFTGQNITAKSLESKANVEFVMANVKNLPTLQEAIAAYVECRNAWNAAPHHKTKISRIEMYQESINPALQQVSMFEIVDMFWIERPKPIMMSAYGLSFVEAKVKYTYMVHNADGLPNIEWLRKNVDKKFVVKYDPSDMSMIYLYEETPKGLRFITEATTKVEIQRNAQEQDSFDHQYITKVIALNKQSRVDTQNQIDTLQEEHGMLPEQYGLNSPRLAGLKTEKKERNRQRNARMADSNKILSNKVPVLNGDEDDDTDIISMY